MVTKHTPGPWRVDERDTWPFDIEVMANEKRVLRDSRWAYSIRDRSLADVMSGVNFKRSERQQVVEGNAEQLANLRLMAAAPKMFEVLEEIAGGLDDVRAPHRFSHAREIARAALAKARGE